MTKRTPEFSPKKLSRLMKQKGVRTELLAVRCDCGGSTVQAWRSGRNTPRANQLPVIAKALGCKIDDLYG